MKIGSKEMLMADLEISFALLTDGQHTEVMAAQGQWRCDNKEMRMPKKFELALMRRLIDFVTEARGWEQGDGEELTQYTDGTGEELLDIPTS